MNQRYRCLDEQMIIGKKTIESTNYDCLVFCVRNAKHVTIPSFITNICSCVFETSLIRSIIIPSEVTRIGKYAFDQCSQLQQVKFGKNSKLQTIEEYAFSDIDIKCIEIPSEVRIIGRGAFANCINLERIIFTKDSKLQTIEEDAFSVTMINSITIPSGVTDLKEGWGSGAEELKKIIVDTSNPRYLSLDGKIVIGKSSEKSTNYDCLVSCHSDFKIITLPEFISNIYSYSFSFLPINSIIIPSGVTRIGKHAFYNCCNLQTVEFPKNSKLQIIEEGVFSQTSIIRIEIPTEVKKIDKFAFFNCQKLRQIELSNDAKIQTIEPYAFQNASINSFNIPSRITDLEEGWCNCTGQLNKIFVSSLNQRYKCINDQFIVGKISSESTYYDCLVFCIKSIKMITIPSYIKHIGPFAFNYSSIKNIIIPSNVIKIGNNAFRYCRNLRRVEILSNSKLQTIENNAFQYSSIESISIPSEVKYIDDKAFYNCRHIKIIEISENSKLESIDNYLSENSKYALFMIPPNLNDLINF